MSELLFGPEAIGDRAPHGAAVRSAFVSGAGRRFVFGWALVFAVLAMATQRARFVGLATPRWSDWLPALVAAAIGVVVGRMAARSVRGAATVGLGVTAVCAGIAGTLLLTGTAAGSWSILLPQVFALAAALALLGTVGAPRGFASSQRAVGAVAAIVGGAIAPSTFSASLVAFGPGATSSIATGAMLAAALAALPGTQPDPTRGGSWCAHGACAAMLLWLAAPAGLWSVMDSTCLAVWGGLGAGAFAAWLGGCRWLAGAFAASALLFALCASSASPRETERLRVLASNGATAAVYSRSVQELQLWCDATLVDAAGPDRPHAELTATLLATLLAPGDRVLLLGLGTGRLPRALQRAGVDIVDAVDFRATARPLLGRLTGAGPVPAATAEAEPQCRLMSRGIAEALAAFRPGARQAIVTAEPLHGRSGAQTTVELQRELRRVVGEGLVVQSFAMDRTPPEALARLLAAAAVAHAWNGVFAVGDCALLLSSSRAPTWPAPAALQAWSDAARWQAHHAHVGSVADLQRAWLGTVAPAAAAHCRDAENAPPTGEPQDRAAVLAVLHDLLAAPAEGPGADPASLLLWWVQWQAELRSACRTVCSLPGGADAGARAQSLAARFLPVGAPHAVLQAALALPDGNGAQLRNPAAASLCAQAIDPTFFFDLPPLFAALPTPRRPGSELEDLADLPADKRLAELCGGDQPLAVGLRARFPSDCARALVAALTHAPLPPAPAQALRELADPFVLREAGLVLSRRAAVRELFGLWRGDLAMPEALAQLQHGSAAERRSLVEALAGRKDEASLRMLGEFLVDPDRSLRGLAGASMFATVGNRVDYDPDWPRSRLLAAAERLRALHNRAP